MKRILIGQLGVYGDCLLATTIARQIKQDSPGCHLTWAIGSGYSSILDGNPDIDYVWVYDAETRWDVVGKWYEFYNDIMRLKARGDYDEIYLTQLYPGHPERFYDTLRAAMFRAYPHPITVPLAPVLNLSEDEVHRVEQFVEDNMIHGKALVVLFEYSPQSNQSLLTDDMVRDIALGIVADNPDSCVIMAGKSKIAYGSWNVRDGSELSFREIAGLTKYCDLMIGTSSGLTWVCQSTAAKQLPMIQLLKPHSTASVVNDHTHFNLPTDHIIEMTNYTAEKVIGCVRAVVVEGVGSARRRYHQEIVPDLAITRFHMRFEMAKQTGYYADIVLAFITAIDDYGLSWGLVRFLSTFPASIATLISRKINGVK